MDIFVGILVFLGILVVAALFVGGWVVVAVVRLLARALTGGRSDPPPPVRLPPPPQRLICAHDNCRAPNPHAARFCRRCGRPVAGRVGGRTPVVRRVAMW